MNLDKVSRLAIPLGVLLAGAGVFYHYVVFLPGLERQKQSQLEAEKVAQENKATQRAVQYELCNQRARSVYVSDWATACQSVADDQKLNYENCLKDPLVMGNQFLGKQYCIRTFGKANPAPDCTLPGPWANSINAAYKDSQQRCLQESKNDL